MTALFKDWDLDGDLDALLIKALGLVVEHRGELSEYDAIASRRRETGATLELMTIEFMTEARAYVTHYTRQICRIREAIEKRENDRLAAEKRNKAGVSVKMK